MIELQLSHFRKARIWLNEFPDANYESSEIFEAEFTASHFYDLKVNRVAVELIIPTGPRTIYGLLGAEFNETSIDNKLKLKVCIADNFGKEFVDSFLASKTNVYVGLKREYLTSVLNGIYSTLKEIDYPSVSIVFKCAACTLEGSNEFIFEALANIVSTILLSNQRFSNDEDYINLIQKCLS